MSPSHQAVVFDIGGVLVDWDPRHLFRDALQTVPLLSTPIILLLQ